MFGKLIKAEWRASRRVVGLLCLAVLLAGLVLGVDVPHHPQQPMAVAALQGLTVLLLAGIGVRLVGGGRLVEHCQ